MPPPTAGTNATVTDQAGVFKAWIYLTQVQGVPGLQSSVNSTGLLHMCANGCHGWQVWQARAYEVASSLWRRIKQEPDGGTMGILYWQLNDIWAVRQHGGSLENG